ncbi:zinc finger protein 311-like [Sitophilus oryzae]|uniref:Zinc finger protein 311-like n=1 Tax=Sitophilus oryzae TaxID=7048 RepID=A0A6J2YYN0_SITOR|nr:zinc finger protein 311-like [Sitophilus oryzae]
MSEGAKSFENLCRTCLAQVPQDALTQIFGNEVLEEKIIDLTNMALGFHSFLPTSICKTCLKYLLIATQYKQQILRVELRLQNIIKMTVDNNDTDFDFPYITPENPIDEENLNIDPESCNVKVEPSESGDEHNVLEAELEEGEVVEENNTDDNCDSSEPKDQPDNDIANITDVLIKTENIPSVEEDPIAVNVNKTKNWPEQKLDRYVEGVNDHEYTIVVFNPEVECEICKITLKDKKTYIAHVKEVHPKEKPVKEPRYKDKPALISCDLCDKKFKYNYSLKLHSVVHTGEKLYKCTYCDEKFKSTPMRIEHEKITHTGGITPYKCEICHKFFNKKYNLTLHIRTHTRENPVACPDCPKRFRNRSALSAHVQVNHSEKKYQCEMCGYKASTMYVLKRHIKRHVLDKSLPCDVCNKMFQTEKDLRYHRRRHTERFGCSMCNVKFRTRLYLKKHIEESHEGQSPFDCSICKQRFESAKDLRFHRFTQHPKKFKCDLCNRSFRNKVSLVKHSKVHDADLPHECKKCGSKFQYKIGLTKHKKEGCNGRVSDESDDSEQ